MNTPGKNGNPRRQQQAFLTSATAVERAPEAAGKSQPTIAEQRNSRSAGGRTGWLHITK